MPPQVDQALAKIKEGYQDLQAALPPSRDRKAAQSATERYIQYLDPERDADLIAAAKARTEERTSAEGDTPETRHLRQSLGRVLRNHGLL